MAARSTADVNHVNATLKGALYETLTSILSPLYDVRTRAEQQLNVLEVTDDFGVHLAELTLQQNAPLEIRQLSSVLLRQYVEVHWFPNSEKFRSPETTAEAKLKIRTLLPMGLQESVSKLRSSVAYAISAIAHWDWPEHWPELFDLLMANLMSENSFAVHGAMRALTEVSRDVSDNQMPRVAPLILPEMLKIFVHPEKYSVRTRGRAVEIFTTCVEVIAAMADYNSSAAKELLFPILPQFSEALVKALIVPDGRASDSGLKKDVLNCLKNLISYFPRQMSHWLPHILTPVWNSLTDSANLYIKTVVNDTEDANNPVDSDGEVLGFENLVFGIFDFVTTLVESRFKGYVQKGLDDLLYYIILYMQITEEQVRSWTTDTDRFVEDEDDESFSYSVRISAQDLLASLSQRFELQTSTSLCVAITRHIQATNKNSNPAWWKIHEACMLALGNTREPIIEEFQKISLQFDLLGFMQSVVLEDLVVAESAPFLFGRCLCTASEFATVMNHELIQRFLQATLTALQTPLPAQHVDISCVIISGVRAVYGFCKHLKAANNCSVLLPYLVPIINQLLELYHHFSSDALGLVLETISVALAVDEHVTMSVEAKVTTITANVFLKHNSDPVMVSLAQDIIKELCRNPGCLIPVQQRLLPILINILQASPSKIPVGVQPVALDILLTLVRTCPSPVPEPLINHAFPAAILCVLHSEDNSTLQNGGECLRAFVSVALEQISAWRDETGHSGLDYVIKVVEHVLDPKSPESASAFIGGLISLLICRVGDALGEKAEHILRAVLSKMQQAESLSVTQNLVLIFAQLCRTQLEHVLNFLSGVPGPTGKSALEFVLTEWCQSHHLFFGAYDSKVSAFALAKLLEYSLNTNDPRLHSIEVKGEIIVNSNCEGVKTRSKSAQNPDEWTMIPLLVKIYKILVQDLRNLFEHYNNQTDEDYSSEEDIEDGHENNSGETPCHVSSPQLSDLLSFDFELDEDDPDIAADPLYSMNFKDYLLNYLQRLSQHPCYSSFSQHHTSQEREFLESLSRQTVQ